MAIGKGFAAGAEIAVEDTFGSLKGMGEAKFPFVSSTETPEPIDIQNEIKQGYGAALQKPEKDRELHRITVISRWDYDNCEPFLQGVMGIENADMSPVAENALIYSVIIDKGMQRYQYTGGMIEELRIIGDVEASFLIIETDWIFAKLTKAADVLQAGALTSSTYLKMQDLTFRIGDTAGVLASGDALTITSFVISIKNNFRVQYVSKSNIIIQPIRELPREVKFGFTTSLFENSDEITAVETAQDAYSILQADLIISDGIGTNSVTIELPEMYPEPGTRVMPPVSDAGLFVYSPTLQCYENINNQTHMGDADQEIRIKTAT